MRDLAVSIMVDLPSWLRRELGERGMQQRELADRLGVHARTVGLWCRGKTTPNAEMLLRMFVLFGYRVTEG